MNITINKIVTVIFMLSTLFWGAAVSVADTKYEIRADGLACPYCAYGIEKKLMAIKGVKYVDVKLKQGKVLVVGEDSLNLKEQQLKTLFNDAGFTYRTMKNESVGDVNSK